MESNTISLAVTNCGWVYGFKTIRLKEENCRLKAYERIYIRYFSMRKEQLLLLESKYDPPKLRDFHAQRGNLIALSSKICTPYPFWTDADRKTKDYFILYRRHLLFQELKGERICTVKFKQLPEFFLFK